MEDRATPDRIDDTTAWNLLRAVPPASAGTPSVVRVHDTARADTWLQVAEDGAWEASDPVTADAASLLDLFLPLQRTATFVVGQIGQSLDGRIATVEGHSHYVTGPEDIRRLHRLRALADAVVVGASTVELDDPQLTVRQAAGRNPLRVVLDPTGRVSADRAVFSGPGAPTLILVGPDAAPPPSGQQAERLTLDTESDEDRRPRFAPGNVLDALATRGVRRVLVEGGGVTVSQFLAAGALTRLHVTTASLIIGSGRPAFTLPVVARLDDALRAPTRVFRLGDDVLFDLDLRGDSGPAAPASYPPGDRSRTSPPGKLPSSTSKP